MLEDLLCKLINPQKAINLLLLFLSDYVQDNYITDKITPIEKLDDIQAIIYALNLVSNDILKLRNEYYSCMKEEFYSGDITTNG